jgi:hypothetical protein
MLWMAMRGTSQVVASLILVMVALGSVGIYFSVVQPLVSSPKGGIVIALTKEPEIAFYGTPTSEYYIVVELRAFNPLTYWVTITNGEAIFLLNGPSNPVLLHLQCRVSGGAGQVTVNPGSIVYITFSCGFVGPGSHLFYNNAFCNAYAGTSNCILTPRAVSDVMKNAVLLSFIVYYTTQGGGYGWESVF